MVCVVAGLLAFPILADELESETEQAAPSLAPESQEHLETLIRTLEILRADPGTLAQVLEQLRAQSQDTRESLNNLEGEITRLGDARQSQSELKDRLDTLRIGETILSTGSFPKDPIAPSEDRASAKGVRIARNDAERLFVDRVWPIFETHCASCHNPDRKRSGLDLAIRANLLSGGESRTPSIVPGNPEASPLYRQIIHAEDPHMPYKEDKLSEDQIASIREWITAGAPYVEVVQAPALERPEEIARMPTKELVVTDADREFWSFRPLDAGELPEVKDEAWIVNPIDRFIRAAQEREALSPTPRANRGKLIRRAYFDLIGLPPLPEDIAAFEADESPDAYESLLDRLLESPRYGERWGRHWLDVARYADSGGYEFDTERPTAYPYRDYVIGALNDDQPFDQFVKWQLAGDEYSPDNPKALAATGFCTSGPAILNQITEKNRYDELDDVLSTTASAFLGLTVACARCHDHKYEPIPQRDYYRMLSVFTTSKPKDVLLTTRAKAAEYLDRERAFEKRLGEVKKETSDLLRALKPLKRPLREAKIDRLSIPDDQKKLLKEPFDKKNKPQRELFEKYRKEIEVSDEMLRDKLVVDDLIVWEILSMRVNQVEGTRPKSPPRGRAITDTQAEPVDSFFLERGNPDTKREKVDLGFLTVLNSSNDAVYRPAVERPNDAKTTFRRTALAEWLTDVDQGAGHLTARVMVNRLWHYHFGEGIVRTPSDFGMQGDRPSHPELLDWLAIELIDNGWRLKPIHRLIMTSATYRQDTTFDQANADVDPTNRLLWRRRPLRLEAEIIRDAILKVSGCLNEEMYGPGVKPWVHPDAIATGSMNKWPTGVVDGPKTWRRSVYAYIRRSALIPMMEVFDGIDSTASCARRMVTTIPPQALSLLNGRFVNDQMRHFAELVRSKAGAEPESWIRGSYVRALGRRPQPSELIASLSFLEKQAGLYRDSTNDEALDSAGEERQDTYLDLEPEELALIDFCQVLINLNEFVYID